MKKTFINLFSAAVLAVSFSSCLGDGGEQSFSANREFGVVDVVSTSSGVITQAALSRGYIITGDEISNYSKGDVILVSYKANLNNIVNSTTIKVDYATVDEQNDVYKVANQKSVIEGSVGNNAPVDGNSFTAMSRLYGHDSKFFQDRWFISVSAQIRKDQDIRGIELYYNKNDQTLPESSSLTLPDDAIVLDMKLLKTDPTSENTETGVKSKDFAINLSSLRLLNPKHMAETTEGKTLYIWVRYPKYSTTDKTYSVGVLQNVFGLTFTSDN